MTTRGGLGFPSDATAIIAARQQFLSHVASTGDFQRRYEAVRRLTAYDRIRAVPDYNQLTIGVTLARASLARAVSPDDFAAHCSPEYREEMRAVYAATWEERKREAAAMWSFNQRGMSYAGVTREALIAYSDHINYLCERFHLPQAWAAEPVHQMLAQDPDTYPAGCDCPGADHRQVYPIVLHVQALAPIARIITSGPSIPVYCNSRLSDVLDHIKQTLPKGSGRKQLLDRIKDEWPALRARLLETSGFIDRERGPAGDMLARNVCWLWHRVLERKRAGAQRVWRTHYLSGDVTWEEFQKGTEAAARIIGLTWPHERARELRV